MRAEIRLLAVYASCVVGSAYATGHGALVLTEPTPATDSDVVVSAGHLSDDPLIQGKIIAALARFDAASVSDLKAREVWSKQDELVGAVDSIAVSRSTGELVVVIALEGLALANLKEVAVPLRQALPKDRFRVLVPYTRAELQAMRDVDPWDNDLDPLG
jgi:hypothetical protein